MARWYTGKHPDKWLYIRIFTDPKLLKEAQPVDINPGFVAPKVGWQLFGERAGKSQDATLILNSPFDQPGFVYFDYRPVLWLSFYWRTQSFNNMSDLR